jgi:hypothetical protein
MSTHGSNPSSSSSSSSSSSGSSLWRWQREHLLLHQAASSDSAWLHGRLLAPPPPPLPQLAHADAAALVGWAIGLRWAAAAAEAFLNAAAATAAADGANAEATGRSVTAAEAATLRLLGACLAGPPPDALRSTGAGGGSSLRLLCALSAAEEAQHRALAAALHARLAAHGPPTAEWAAAADEALPAVRGARALVFPRRP